jgi:gliding motility-associated-like protein
MKKTILIVFISLIVNTVAFPQWTQTSGPEGVSSEEIVKVGSVLILSAGNGGIYKSLDNGDSWALSSSGLPCNEGVKELLEHNGILYTSITRSGIYMSEDEGENWIPINSGIESFTFNGLMVDGTNIYAGNANGGVYFSSDNGTSWLNKSNGIPNILLINNFITFNSKIYAAGHPNTSAPFPSLYETSNDGDTWTSIDIPNLNINGISAMTTSNGFLYVGDFGGHVFSSFGNLTSWNQTNINTGATITSMVTDANTVYCTTSSGRYFYTQDNGLNWTQIQNLGTNRFVNNLFFNNPKIIMSTSEGLFQSLDLGNSWSLNNNGINGLQITSLNSNSSYLFAGTSGQGIFRSPDSGTTWNIINNGFLDLNSHTIHDINIVGNNIYLATDGGIYASTNNGDTWIRKFNLGAHAMNSKNGTLVAAGGGGVYVSMDMGNSWNLKHNIQTGFESIFIEGSIIGASTRDGRILISEDMGNSWVDISIPNGNHYTKDLLLVDGKLYAATVVGLFVSDDLGINWISYNNDSKIIQNIIVEFDKIYAATDTGVYISNECNIQWYPICEGIGQQWINKILLQDDNIYVGTFSSSVWKRLKAEAELILDQNCPSNNITLCTNNNIQVNLFQSLNGNPNTGGSWSPSLASGSGIFDPSVDSSGIYTYSYIEESSFCECEVYKKIEVFVNESLNAGTNAELSICINSKTVDLFESLGGNPDSGGTWNPNLFSGTGLFDPEIDAPGIYTYTVTNENCGDDTSKLQITIIQEPNAGLDNILSICSNDSVIDLFTLLGDSPDNGGIWRPHLFSGTSIFDPSIDISGIYTYTVSNDGCEDVSEILVTVNSELNTGNDGELSICKYSKTVDLFESLGGKPDIGGTWNPSLSSGTGLFNPFEDSAGIYTYTLEGDCVRGISNVSVNIFDSYETPNYNINVVDFSNENSIIISVNSGSPYEFSLDGVIFQENNTFSNLIGGSYTVFGKEINGCGVFQKEVWVLSYPKFFTPNNDGYNDNWQIYGVEEYPNARIYIFDRFGKILKQISPNGIGWNGIYNGKIMPSTDYWFTVNLNNGRTIKGHFSLKR